MTLEVIEKGTHHNEAQKQGLSVHDFVVGLPHREWSLYPETRKVLDEVRSRGYKTALISNFNDEIHTLLKELGIYDKFDFVISSQEAGVPKPDPRIYQFALKKLDLLAEEALMIGDNYDADYQAPLDLGMQALFLDRNKSDLSIVLKDLN